MLNFKGGGEGEGRRVVLNFKRGRGVEHVTFNIMIELKGKFFGCCLGNYQ